MVEVLRHKVRFGELSYGPLIHNASFFDLLIVATEELSYELGYTVEEIVEKGGVPYAPVAIHADIERYPRYEDTIVVTADPVSIGDNHVQFDYRFVRESEGVEFGSATMVQVTIQPDKTAESVSPELREEISALGFSDRAPIDISPRAPTGDGLQFSRDVVFRTPLLEGADLGYFEDYARELSIGIEQFVENRSRSLRSLSEDTYPFVPASWDITLENSIRFEDEITIVGEVLDADEQAVDVAYELRRESTDDVCIRADLTYGCFDETGERVPLPADAVDVVRPERADDRR